MSSWQSDQVWKFELNLVLMVDWSTIELWCKAVGGAKCVHWAWGRVTVYMAAYSEVTVTEWPTWLPYSHCSYLCRKPAEAGQVSLEWRSKYCSNPVVRFALSQVRTAERKVCITRKRFSKSAIPRKSMRLYLSLSSVACNKIQFVNSTVCAKVHHSLDCK